MTGRRNTVSYSKVRTGKNIESCSVDSFRSFGCVDAVRTKSLLDCGDRADMHFKAVEASSEFKLIEVREHGGRFRILLEADQVEVKKILHFLSFVSQFTHTFFYKAKATAVSDEKEQARRERQARYEEWCIGTVLPMFRTLQGTPTEKFRKMKEWLNAQGETLEFMGGRENGYLRAEVESLIYNARKFERAAKKNINSNLKIPADIVVMNDAAGGDVS